eukprot:22197_1
MAMSTTQTSMKSTPKLSELFAIRRKLLKKKRLSINLQQIWKKLEMHTPTHTLNHDQFNIVLNNNHIVVDPDMSVNIFYELVLTWDRVEAHHNAYTRKKKERMEEKGNNPTNPTQQYKIKYIKKRVINQAYAKRIVRHCDRNNKRVRHCDRTNTKSRGFHLFVLMKIFEALEKGVMFNVQDDYISQPLSENQLNDPSFLLNILQTREANWKQRVQCLEFIESNIDKCFHESDFLRLISGWMTQLYDERSRVTQTAAELFPSLLVQTLPRMDAPEILFAQENGHGCLGIIMDGLFTLLKTKRAKTLSDIAHRVLIQTIDILSSAATELQLDDTAFCRMMDILYQHTTKIEKHQKVRAGCVVYALFMFYGIESIDNAQIRAKEVAARQSLFSLAKVSDMFGKTIGNCVEDKSQDARENAMKVIKKIEMTNSEVIERFIDPIHYKKYKKWKRFKKRKKGGQKTRKSRK